MLEDTIFQADHFGNVYSAEEDHLDLPLKQSSPQHIRKMRLHPWCTIVSPSHRVPAVSHWSALEYRRFGTNGSCAGLEGELNRIRQ